jgi:hypothetical protein
VVSDVESGRPVSPTRRLGIRTTSSHWYLVLKLGVRGSNLVEIELVKP